jgi:predicted ATPase
MVALLFTDVEGSTLLLDELGPQRYSDVLGRHRRIVREACARHGGVEVDTQGDAFFFVFSAVLSALAAAEELTSGLADERMHVRAGVHVGTPLLTAEGYVGADVHRAARIAAAGSGGQVLVSASAAAGVDLPLRDLGEHRFKDLAMPERIFQLGDGDFPPLRSLYRSNLPVQATQFLGRQTELAELVELVRERRSRLLTLTGPGGIGKTRLALQAAAEAADAFPDGLWWVGLAPLRDARLVLEAVAQSVGVAEGPLERLAGANTLIVLDNVEHLLPGATAAVATLRDLDGPLVLATSRERLNVAGEQVWPVPPLNETDGGSLFLTRARESEPSFSGGMTVAEICRRLDHLPLAIELAAARVTLFSPDELLERLSDRLDLLRGARDVDPRQQTLRATIDWSYDLLSDRERTLFRRLAVFAGGCTVDAVHDVAGGDPGTLQALVDKSLLRGRVDEAGHTRFWMLETIREYASERLAESRDDGDVGRRHGAWCVELAERLHGDLWRPTHEEAMRRFDADRRNIAAALACLRAAGEGMLMLRLAAGTYEYWMNANALKEGRRWLSQVLADTPTEPAGAARSSVHRPLDAGAPAR